MCPPFLTVSHKYAISFDNDVLISSANIPAELHVVVCLFTRPSFLFLSLIFRRGVVAEGLETRLDKHCFSKVEEHVWVIKNLHMDNY